MLSGKVLELRSNVLMRADGASTHAHTTVLWGQKGFTNPGAAAVRGGGRWGGFKPPD